MAVALNRDVDDFLGGYSKLGVPEERMEHKVEGSLMFDGHEDLMRQYEEVLNTSGWNEKEQEYKFYLAAAKIDLVLRPEQINSFLQTIIRYEEHNSFWKTGYLITQLMQNSHNAGNNKFTLNTRALSKEIDCIGFELKGSKDRLLEIIIEGDIGENCGYDARNINGLYISGNAGEHCGLLAMNSTFKTPNKQTLQLLKQNVQKDEGNKIYFVNKNGKEKEIKW
ncbi:MAG: hypothetical protein ABIB71_06890 [Candidatus Woesearchaeota archaeon]